MYLYVCECVCIYIIEFRNIKRTNKLNATENHERPLRQVEQWSQLKNYRDS